MLSMALQPGLLSKPNQSAIPAFVRHQAAKKNTATPEVGLKGTLPADSIYFSGKRRKPETESESESTDNTDGSYYPESSDDTDSSLDSAFEADSASSASEEPPTTPYDLRKRPKKIHFADPPVDPPKNTPAATTGPNKKDKDDQDKENLENQTTQIILHALLTPNASDLDDQDFGDNGRYPFQVISYKKSPFGPKEPILGFKRIAGMDSLKDELTSLVIDPLKNPDLYKQYGLANSANGVLLYGPPGCGKTFFAKALAEEAQANYLEIHPSAIASTYIHGTSGLIGDVFRLAGKAANKNHHPTIILIDEIDAVAPNRSGGGTEQHRNEEVAEFLNQLNESGNKNIFVIGTTNRPDNLDPALVRSGRMNGKVYLGAPDKTHREAALKLYLQKRPQQGLKLPQLAEQTQGYSMADLRELVNQAARYALKERKPINMAAFEKALKTLHPSISPSTESEYKEMIGIFDGGNSGGIPEFIRHLYT